MKFDCKALTLTDQLSVSLDIEGFPEELEKTVPVFLFAPFDPTDPLREDDVFTEQKDHYHITITKEKAVELRDWLNDFIHTGMGGELLKLPNLNMLYAKKKMRELRLNRIESVNEENKDNKVSSLFGVLVLEKEKQLIAEVEKEIQDVHDKIMNISCIEDAFLKEIFSKSFKGDINE